MQYAEGYHGQDRPENPSGPSGVKGIFANLSAKASFIFGLVGGMMLLFSIGFFIMLGVYFKGGFPETAAKNSNTNNANKVVAGANANTNTNSAPSAPLTTDYAIADTDHVRGNKDAKVTILEWSDFQCPYCEKFHETMVQLMKAYPNDVRWVFKNFPLSFHPEATPAAIAAECAAKQKGNDVFWQYSDKLYENQATLGTDLYKQIAKDLGLNATQFNDCITNKTTASVVTNDTTVGTSNGVQGTPGNFLNGTELGGAVSYASLEAQVKAIIGK